MGRNKITLLLVTVLIASLITTLAAVKTTASPSVLVFYLKDKAGNPVKNKSFTIIIFDKTTNERILGTTVTSDEEGKVEVELTTSITNSNTYNFTIVINEYNKTYLFHYVDSLAGSDLLDLNETSITGEHYWNLYFVARTDLNRDGKYETPVYFVDPEDPSVVDAAKVVVYINNTEVWECSVNKTGVTTTTFNVSDLVVNVDSEYHVEAKEWTKFLVKAFWTEHELVIANETIHLVHTVPTNVIVSPSLTTVANATLVHDEVANKNITWDSNWQVSEYDTTVVMPLSNMMGILLKSYTALLRVTIADVEGNTVDVGSTPVKVFVEYEGKIIRAGVPAVVSGVSTAPAEGYTYNGVTYFWLPNVTAIYGKGYNVEVTYLGVLVYNGTILATAANTDYTANCSLVKTVIYVKDLEPTRQPLASSGTEKVRVTLTGPVTIVTYAGDGGVVALPPYRAIQSPEGISETVYSPYGYLPIPWGWYKANVTTEYNVKVEWKSVWMPKFIDVSVDGNTTIKITSDNYANNNVTYVVLGALYQAKIQIVDMCGKPLYAAKEDGMYPNAYVDVYAPDGTLIVRTTPTLKTGLLPIARLPASSKVGGSYKVKLYWKGFTFDPVAFPGISNATSLNVTDNIDTAVKFVFPIRDVVVIIHQWDNSSRVIQGLNVTLAYPNYKEPWQTTNEKGEVIFKEVPVTDVTGVKYTIQAYTTGPEYGASAYTPYIRPKDANILVLNTTISVPSRESITEPCNVTVSYAAWIYSFKIEVYDSTGEHLLKSFEVYDSSENAVKYYNITLLIVDESYPDTGADYRIMNVTWIGNPDVTPEDYFDNSTGTTGPEAIFIINSNQSSTYPHLFIAGANYTIRVFYGGVMVYNYTITLPRPDESTTEYFNETAFCNYLNTTLVDKPYHPIMSYTAVSPGETPVIKLYTWVVPVDVYAVTNGGKYALTKFGVILNITDALSANFTSLNGYSRDTVYSTLASFEETNWASYKVDWYEVEGIDTDGVGKVTFLVPVWTPTNITKGWKHFNGYWFGTPIKAVYVLGNKDWGTPGIVTDGYYCLNYLVKDSTEYIGMDAAKATTWNITNWSYDWKKITTLALDSVKVQVYGPDLRGVNKPVKYQYIEIYVGSTKITEGYKTTTASYEFVPPTSGSITLPDDTTLSLVKDWALYKYTTNSSVNFKDASTFNYTFVAKQNFDEHPVIKALGVSGFTEKYFKVESLSTEVTLTKDHETGDKIVELYWKTIYIHLMDFDGKNLAHMTVLVYKPDSALPCTFAITSENGTAVAYVASTTTEYRLEVYWLDSWFLEQAGKTINGKPVKAINIYSYADERRTWKAGETAVIQAYVYIGLLKLTKTDGSSLSSNLLSRIVVYVTWPDGAVTKHIPAPDGTVKLVMNSSTIITLAGTLSPESPCPQSPIGDYSIKVVITKPKEVEIYKAPISITKNRMGPAEQLRTVKTNVVDFTLALVTPFGTPMAGANVTIIKADGSSVSTTTAKDGTVKIVEAPLGTVTIKVTGWKKISADLLTTTVTGKMGATVPVTVPKIGKLVVLVQGTRGQGLAGADVVIKYGGVTIEKGTTGADGTYVTELPEGTYTVTASYYGKTGTVTVTVKPGEVTPPAKITLDIFVTIAGWTMSFSEFTGLVVLIIIIIIVLFIGFYHYSEWRRKKLLPAIVPAKPGA